MSTHYPFLKSAREERHFEQLMTTDVLVPYVGPGFMQGLQTKSKLLARFLKEIRKEHLTEDDLDIIGTLNNADAFAYLFEKTGRIVYRKLSELDDAPRDPADADKIRSFAAAFPGLKITGLVDTLLDRWLPDSDTETPITDPIDLSADRILKLNGDLKHPDTLTLATGQINQRIRAIYTSLNRITGKASLLYLGREHTSKALQNRNRKVQFIIAPRSEMNSENLRDYSELNIVPVWIDAPEQLPAILAALAGKIEETPGSEPTAEVNDPSPPIGEKPTESETSPEPRQVKRSPDRIYALQSVKLRQVQGFSELTLDGQTALKGMTLIPGGSRCGKTSLLRAIALGLCHPTEAAALLRSYAGFFVRRDEPEGSIDLVLRRKDGSYLRILTTVTRRGGMESLTRKYWVSAGAASPDMSEASRQPSSWTSVAVMGFGSTRFAERTVRMVKGDRVSDAVATLFHPYPLQDPEYNMRNFIDAAVSGRDGRGKQEQEIRRSIETLLSGLLLDKADDRLILTDEGIAVEIDGTRLPLDVQAESLQSSAAWLLELIAGFAGAETEPEHFEGLVLIDEIDRYLDAEQQKSIPARLHRTFPKIQWLITSKSDYCLEGLTDIEQAACLRLHASEGAIFLKSPVASS
ncbi:MAG: ATP-binding protein [Acidobacteriota bacterium]|nr:ATP-binding protein [Acidobacteriota bacterium]